MSKLVTIVTATTGNPLLIDNIKSVLNQSYDSIQHLLVVDGPDRWETVDHLIRENSLGNSNLDVIKLPYSVGKDRYNGHRIYGASTYLAEGDFIIYLDDDNTLEPNHIADCIKVIESGKDWAYAFRNIIDNHTKICEDNCESLGKWHSIIDPRDFFVDVNCYFLPKQAALSISPVWFRKFREPGQPEIDRVMFHVLANQVSGNFDSTYNYSVNYTVGNSPLSVQKDFFIQGNERMLQLHQGKLPWKK